MKIILYYCISLFFQNVKNGLDYNFKLNSLKEDELNIVIMGDFGYEEYKSEIKRKVVASIKEKHKAKKFNLGIILGDNVYPLGPTRGDHTRTQHIFTDSFPATDFNFDFLTLLGNHEYFGDIEEQFEFYKTVDSRFYIPERFYKYGVDVNSKFKVSFVCVDSTPIIEKWMIKAFDLHDRYQMERVEEMFRNNSGTKFTFLLSHHNLIKAFGPHVEFSDDNFLNRLTYVYPIEATINGHNHNMQYVSADNGRRTQHFLVGNSAKKTHKTTDYTKGTGWYFDQKGGFAQLEINEKVAKFTFFDEDGNELKSVDITPLSQKKSTKT